MKVTLIHGKYFNSWEALGLAYIAGYLRKNVPGIELKFFQGCFDDDEAVVKGSLNSDIIAFSVNTPTFPYAVKIANAVKAINPRVHTVVGGYHPSSFPESCIVPGIDQVVVGEGEAAMLDIVNGNREKIITGRMMQFSELPWPDRALIRNERNIAVAYKDNQQNIVSFQTHRACPFQCKYCLDGANKVLYGTQKAIVRHRDVSDALDEIESVVKTYNLHLIKFSDPTWNVDIDWIKKFCLEKIRRNITVPFYPNIHAGVTSEDMFQLMAQANCEQIAIGVESGSPKILKQIGKGTTTDTIKRSVAWAKKAGILVRGYFILGMPEETDEDLSMTEQFAAELDLDEYGFSILCPYPGTVMFDRSTYETTDWVNADEYSNGFWRTKYLTNGELKVWQRKLLDRFKRNLTLRNLQAPGEKID